MLLQFANFHNLPSLSIAITLLVIRPSLAAPLTFNFPSFTPNDHDIRYEGSASTVVDSIQLARNQQDKSNYNSSGRVTYAQPLPLWDKASGNLADFNTSFSLIIYSLRRTIFADGIAFFLAPYGSRIANTKHGGSLGLASDGQYLNSTDNPFVAVEFDVYGNDWDPIPGNVSVDRDHVGIDISSMKSVTNVSWGNGKNTMSGNTNYAWISYTSGSKNLSVVFSTPGGLKSLHYIVDLREYLPEQVTFGFSGATGNSSAVLSICSWCFSSTLQESNSKTKLVIGMIVGVTVVMIGVSIVLVFVFQKRRRRRSHYEDHTMIVRISEFEKGNGPKKFGYADLARATNNFAEKEKLGQGGFGGVYRGRLTGLHTDVAVKRVSKGSSQGVKEYASEIMVISRLRHRNLVQLIGWCHEKGQFLLVYEFMPNGSLDTHLFKGKSLLTWKTRYEIAKGIASALLYLHEEWEQCVIHRDIKSSNVMLDSEFNAKLGDFGLARLIDHEKDSQTTIPAGTIGYMAPEMYTTHKASKETDVFSFGIVALEISCGRKAIDLRGEESEMNLVEWAWRLYGAHKLTEAADSKLSSGFNEEEMKTLMIVGLWCTHPDSKSRPSIREASRVLNFEAALPSLPSRMPEPVYATPLPTTFSTSSSYGTSDHASGQINQSASIYSTNSSKFTDDSGPHSPSTSLLTTH